MRLIGLIAVAVSLATTAAAHPWQWSAPTPISPPSYVSRMNEQGPSIDSNRARRFMAVWQHPDGAIVFSFSEKDGTQWTAQSTVSAVPQGYYLHDPKVAFAGSHQWACAWLISPTSDPYTSEVFGCTTQDDGQHWSTPVFIGSKKWAVDGNELALAASTNGQVLATWAPRSNHGIAYARSSDGGLTYALSGQLTLPGTDGEAFHPQIVFTGGTSFLLSCSIANFNPSGAEIYRTNDAGESWSGPVGLDVPVTFLTALASDGGKTVLIAWSEYKTDELLAARQFVSTSNDGGGHWSSKVEAFRSNDGTLPRLTITHLRKKHWAMVTDDSISSDITALDSFDNGRSWSPRVAIGDNESMRPEYLPHIAAGKNAAVAVWLRGGVDPNDPSDVMSSVLSRAPLADLHGSWITAPVQICTPIDFGAYYCEFQGMLEVSNAGAVAKNFSVSYFLSYDHTVDADDLLAQQDQVQKLGANSSIQLQFSQYSASGRPYLITVIDSNAAVPETNEANNILVSSNSGELTNN